MPKRTARHQRVSRVPLRVKLLAFAVVAFVGAIVFVSLVGFQDACITFLVMVAMFTTFMSTMEIRWRTWTRRTPEAEESLGFPYPPMTDEQSGISFDVLVPARNESAVLAATLRRIASSPYGGLKTFVTLRDDDLSTIEAACGVQRELGYDRLQVVIRNYDGGSKPLQLNSALPEGSGDVVTVFDAEDEVHEDLPAYVAAIFKNNPDVDIVQAGVQLVNLDIPIPENAGWWRRRWLHARGWFCVHNDLEYYFWFNGRMQYQGEQGVIPLGGNTLFIRRAFLENKLGGWKNLLTEDCDMGIRATALYDAKVVVVYDPRLATREETPDRLISRTVKGEDETVADVLRRRVKAICRVAKDDAPKASTLVTQRTRWSQGFLEVLLKGDWRQLKTLKQRLMAVYLLGMPFIQAFNGLMVPVSIVASLLLVAPVGFAMLMWMPLLPLFGTLLLQIGGLRRFARDYAQKLRPRHYVSLVVGFYPYQLVLAWAAIIAIRRLIAGETDWLLTSHSGFHRLSAASPVSPAPVVDRVKVKEGEVA